MGLFDFFKKKNADTDVQPENTNAQLTAESALSLLLERMHGGFRVPDEIRDNKVYLPDWNIEISPRVQKIDERSAFLVFVVSSPDWEKPMIEGSAGMGRDSGTALGMALGSFMFAFMDGLSRMMLREEPRTLTTTFNGREHHWKVWLSSVVGMGERGKNSSAEVYWEMLKDSLVKRLGNQKVCTVKIFASRIGSNVTGECRIDDEPSRDLGGRIAAHTLNWQADSFVSEKQYIFIEQDDDTFVPHRYPKAESNAEFRSKVKTCMEMYFKAETKEEHDALPAKMAEATGDAVLADECFHILPEILAQHAFNNDIEFYEYFELSIGSRNMGEIYNHQLSEYYPLKNTALSLLNANEFGKDTKAVYSLMTLSSAVGKVIADMTDKGSDLKNARMTALKFNLSDKFELR